MVNVHSPLNEHPAARQPPLTLRERPYRGHINLRGQPNDPAFVQAVTTATDLHLPTRPNTVSRTDNLSALWLGPDEWLLVTPPDGQAGLETQLNTALADVFAAVTDVSSYYTTIEITGHHAADLLARGTAVDLHPRAFGPDHCAQTLLAKTTAIIVQTDTLPVFEVIVRQSFADYLWGWLVDAKRNMA